MLAKASNLNINGRFQEARYESYDTDVNKMKRSNEGYIRLNLSTDVMKTPQGIWLSTKHYT